MAMTTTAVYYTGSQFCGDGKISPLVDGDMESQGTLILALVLLSSPIESALKN